MRYSFVGILTTAALICPVVAQASELSGWHYNPDTYELTFSLPQDVLPEFFLLAEPTRIVLDIPNTQIGAIASEQTYTGAVERIRVSQFSDSDVRVVIDLAPGTELQPTQASIEFDDANGQRQWRFQPLIASASPDPASEIAAEPNPEQSAEPNTIATIPDLSVMPIPNPAMSEMPEVPFVATPGTDPVPSAGAAALQLPTPTALSPTTTPLPLDPYASAEASPTVSVPALTAAAVAPVVPPADTSWAEPMATLIEPPFLEVAPEVSHNATSVPGVQPEPASQPEPTNQTESSRSNSPWPATIEFGQPLPR
jgi:AMIN domain